MGGGGVWEREASRKRNSSSIKEMTATLNFMCHLSREEPAVFQRRSQWHWPQEDGVGRDTSVVVRGLKKRKVKGQCVRGTGWDISDVFC